MLGFTESGASADCEDAVTALPTCAVLEAEGCAVLEVDSSELEDWASAGILEEALLDAEPKMEEDWLGNEDSPEPETDAATTCGGKSLSPNPATDCSNCVTLKNNASRTTIGANTTKNINALMRNLMRCTRCVLIIKYLTSFCLVKQYYTTP